MTSERFQTLNTGSMGVTSDTGRRIEPSASRNADAICAMLSSYVPAEGRALEIASGSGQHIARFAREFPGVQWQPSEIDPARIVSIKSWIAEVGAANLADPIILDATTPGWAARLGSFDVIVMVNLLHLISMPEAETIITEAGQALAKAGKLVIYGPFKRGDQFASEGDERFHLSLAAQDSAIGYKSFESIQDVQKSSGLKVEAVHEMPANNLTLVATKP